MLRDVVRRIAVERIAPYAAAVDEEARFPSEAYDALREAGLHAPHVPEAYGGDGADALAVSIVVEEVARACTSSSLIPAVNKLGSLPLLLGGSEELCARYLPALASGNSLFSFALSEGDAGSDIASMRTRATPNGNGWVLNGTKRWITNAGESDVYVVMAVSEPPAGTHGITAFIVERSDPGVSFGPPERKLGIRGSPTREVILRDVAVGPDRVVGVPGRGIQLALATLDHTRVTIAAQAVGIAQAALDLAISYLAERRQFGRPLADFQGLQFMVADMAIQIEAARQLTYVAAAMSERDDPALGPTSASAKCFASDVAMRVTTDTVQLLGGAGYTCDYPAERLMRDAKITQIYEGTNQIQRIIVARNCFSRNA
jgi:alkylation response protein AidB-like acyl-CoA dehydrogenase